MDALLSAVAAIASGAAPPVAYEQDAGTGDFAPVGMSGWAEGHGALRAACARG